MISKRPSYKRFSSETSTFGGGDFLGQGSSFEGHGLQPPLDPGSRFLDPGLKNYFSDWDPGLKNLFLGPGQRILYF